MELDAGYTLHVPGRFAIFRRGDPRVELRRLSSKLVEGIEALNGLYLRMCDIIRDSDLTDAEVRETLSEFFPPPRISEILRVSHAPPEVYRRYRLGFFGFKAALERCRGYTVTRSEELRRRKLRRAAERLVLLAGGPVRLRVRGRLLVVE